MTVIPLFSEAAGCGAQISSLRLPVAPRAQSSRRFMSPVKSAALLSPRAALALLEQVIASGRPVESVEIGGPGDPLATPELTLKSIGLIRNRYPDMPISLTTLGFDMAFWIDEFKRLAVVPNFQLDAVRTTIVEKVFTWIRPDKKTIPLTRVAPLLIESQAHSMKSCREQGLKFTVTASLFDDYESDHIEEIAAVAARAGAESLTLQPFDRDDREDRLSQAELDKLVELEQRLARYLPLARSPRYISPGEAAEAGSKKRVAAYQPGPESGRPNAAILSAGGMDVDLHLGRARRVLIYGPRDDGLICFLETRKLPEAGGGDQRWHQVAGLLNDCFALLTASCGQKPREILEQEGVAVISTRDEIAGVVDLLYGGGRRVRCKQ